MKHVVFYPFPKANCAADAKRVLGQSTDSMGKSQDKWLGIDEDSIVYADNNSEQALEKLAALTGDDMLHICGHCTKGWPRLQSPDHETETDSYAIVTLLESLGYEFTSDLLVRGCFSATPTVDHRSFASLLKEQIVERSHPNPSVFAYTTAVIKDWENEYTYLDMMRGVKPYGGSREFKLISQV